MIALAARGPDDWKPPIVTTVAITGDGIGELVGQLDAHRAWLERSGEGDRRRAARAREEVAALALGALRRKMARLPGDSALGALAGRVAEGQIDPYSAADELLGALTDSA
jgi:LAO/AO transport system kinase